ncbi:VOC family protein [Pelagovum pacificum]|uniref:VOC family protein n=1 Tax=Pelagovum pacificum TaxID=2588711 RepID=A0A5C5GCA5_9RHOB|nr:VOC family protein [Pelagovum pacificum]QQA44503.1 VOC family protein [Pelagovum pacificum]TNY32383.1 VOC family protein [Pelagovum pacificum]
MIGYVTIGSADPAAAAAFFDPLFAELGGARAYTLETMIAWGFGPKRPLIMVTRPWNGEAATPGNGAMIALMARDAAQVNRLHALALSLGGRDEGAPGPRGEGFYGGYFRDPEGNKFNAFVYG